MTRKAAAKPRKRRPGAQKSALVAKRKRSACGRAEDLIDAMGAGKNQVYEALDDGKVEGAFRWGRVWFIPWTTINKLTGRSSAISATPSAPPVPAPATPEPPSAPTATVAMTSNGARSTTNKGEGHGN
jgi:hypothetical protein